MILYSVGQRKRNMRHNSFCLESNELITDEIGGQDHNLCGRYGRSRYVMSMLWCWCVVVEVPIAAFPQYYHILA